MYRHTLTGIVLMLVLTSCGGGRQRVMTDTLAPRPTAVLVEHEVSGVVLKQSLLAPIGLDVNRRGDVYVVDAGNNRLVEFDSSLTPIRETGGYGRSEGQLDQPSRVTVDNDLNLWVTDVGNRRLCRFDRGLHFVDAIELEDDEDLLKYGRPGGLAVTTFGEVWLSDMDNDRLSIFDNTGSFSKHVEGFGYGGGQLRSPEEIASFDDRTFFVCDVGNQRVALFDEYGSFLGEIADDRWRQPAAMAFDSSRRLWLLDAETATLYCLSLTGEEQLVVSGRLPGTTVPLRNPSDIVFDRQGRLIISDTGNNRVLVCRVTYDQN